MENLKLFKRVIVLQTYKPLHAETAKQMALNISIHTVFYFVPNIVEQFEVRHIVLIILLT